MVHLKLVSWFVEKQVMLPAALPDIESEILGCKNILFAKITYQLASSRHRTHYIHKLRI